MDYKLNSAEQEFGFNNRYALIPRQLGEFLHRERATDYVRAAVLLDPSSLYEPHAFSYAHDDEPYDVKAIVSMGEFGYLIGTLAESGDDSTHEVMIAKQYIPLLEGLAIETHEISTLFYAIVVTGLPIAGVVRMLDHCMKDPECIQVVENKGFIPDHFADDWTSPMEKFMKALDPGVTAANQKTRIAYMDKFPEKRKLGGSFRKK